MEILQLCGEDPVIVGRSLVQLVAGFLGVELSCFVHFVEIQRNKNNINNKIYIYTIKNAYTTKKSVI